MGSQDRDKLTQKEQLEYARAAAVESARDAIATRRARLKEIEEEDRTLQTAVERHRKLMAEHHRISEEITTYFRVVDTKGKVRYEDASRRQPSFCVV